MMSFIVDLKSNSHRALPLISIPIYVCHFQEAPQPRHPSLPGCRPILWLALPHLRDPLLFPTRPAPKATRKAHPPFARHLGRCAGVDVHVHLHPAGVGVECCPARAVGVRDRVRSRSRRISIRLFFFFFSSLEMSLLTEVVGVGSTDHLSHPQVFLVQHHFGRDVRQRAVD